MSDVRPYQGGDWAIYGLHRLDISDKHKLILRGSNYTSVNGLRVEDGDGEVEGFTAWSGVGVNHIDFIPGIHVKDHGKISVSIDFGDGMPFEHMSIAEILSMSSGRTKNDLESMIKTI